MDFSTGAVTTKNTVLGLELTITVIAVIFNIGTLILLLKKWRSTCSFIKLCLLNRLSINCVALVVLVPLQAAALYADQWYFGTSGCFAVNVGVVFIMNALSWTPLSVLLKGASNVLQQNCNKACAYITIIVSQWIFPGCFSLPTIFTFKGDVGIISVFDNTTQTHQCVPVQLVNDISSISLTLITFFIPLMLLLCLRRLIRDQFNIPTTKHDDANDVTNADDCIGDEKNGTAFPLITSQDDHILSANGVKDSNSAPYPQQDTINAGERENGGENKDTADPYLIKHEVLCDTIIHEAPTYNNTGESSETLGSSLITDTTLSEKRSDATAYVKDDVNKTHSNILKGENNSDITIYVTDKDITAHVDANNGDMKTQSKTCELFVSIDNCNESIYTTSVTTEKEKSKPILDKSKESHTISKSDSLEEYNESMSDENAVVGSNNLMEKDLSDESLKSRKGVRFTETNEIVKCTDDTIVPNDDSLHDAVINLNSLQFQLQDCGLIDSSGEDSYFFENKKMATWLNKNKPQKRKSGNDACATSYILMTGFHFLLWIPVYIISVVISKCDSCSISILQWHIVVMVTILDLTFNPLCIVMCIDKRTIDLCSCLKSSFQRKAT